MKPLILILIIVPTWLKAQRTDKWQFDKTITYTSVINNKDSTILIDSVVKKLDALLTVTLIEDKTFTLQLTDTFKVLNTTYFTIKTDSTPDMPCIAVELRKPGIDIAYGAIWVDNNILTIDYPAEFYTDPTTKKRFSRQRHLQCHIVTKQGYSDGN